MKIFGLTGKTGAGKTTVAEALRRRGWYVIDTDLLARQVVEIGSPTLAALVDAFGTGILCPDGSLDRKGLVRTAVATPNGVATLNAITHPAIDNLVEKALLTADAAGYRFAVIDAAALLESPTRLRCDAVIVVHANEDLRRSRIMTRDGLSQQDAQRRMQMQKADAYYLDAADAVICNEPPHDLDAQILALEERYETDES